MKYTGTIIKTEGNHAILKYHSNSSGASWGASCSRDGGVREVNVINTIGAKVGDEVAFRFPNLIDFIKVFKHLIWPFLLCIIAWLLLSSAFQNFTSGSLNIIANMMSLGVIITIYALIVKHFIKKGIVSGADSLYTIELLSIIKREDFPIVWFMLIIDVKINDMVILNKH